jgi:hypothetical protein
MATESTHEEDLWSRHALICEQGGRLMWPRTHEMDPEIGMKWIKDLFWDPSLTVRDNLATWALGIICFSAFYVLLVLVLILGEAP